MLLLVFTPVVGKVIIVWNRIKRRVESLKKFGVGTVFAVLVHDCFPKSVVCTVSEREGGGSKKKVRKGKTTTTKKKMENTTTKQQQ